MRAAAETGGSTGYLDTPHGRLRWAARGRADAPPLLVLHGMGDSLGGWAQAALPLLLRFRVHLLDLPGHGLSGAPPDWRLGTLVAAVRTYARALDRPLIVGHSLGGWLAVRLLQVPPRDAPPALFAPPIDAAGLVLVNPAGMLPQQAEWDPFLQLVQASDARGARAYLRHAFHAPPLALRMFPGEVVAAMRAESTRGFLGGLAAGDFLAPEELAALRLPLRLVWGESDRLLPAGTLEFFRRHLPAHDFVPIARSGHMPHLEAPLRLARAIAARLR